MPPDGLPDDALARAWITPEQHREALSLCALDDTRASGDVLVELRYIAEEQRFALAPTRGPAGSLDPTMVWDNPTHPLDITARRTRAGSMRHADLG